MPFLRIYTIHVTLVDLFSVSRFRMFCLIYFLCSVIFLYIWGRERKSFYLLISPYLWIASFIIFVSTFRVSSMVLLVIELCKQLDNIFVRFAEFMGDGLKFNSQFSRHKGDGNNKSDLGSGNARFSLRPQEKYATVQWYEIVLAVRWCGWADCLKIHKLNDAERYRCV